MTNDVDDEQILTFGVGYYGILELVKYMITVKRNHV